VPEFFTAEITESTEKVLPSPLEGECDVSAPADFTSVSSVLSVLKIKNVIS
jgi:hypothetical protein